MSTTALKVSGLTTHFETRAGIAKAVNDVSFSVEQGQILALVGESGSGKSVTAMSLMNLVDPPGRVVAGEILLRGKNIRAASAGEWNRIRGKEMAMVFQDPMMSLNPVIRVGDQITETIRIHDKVSGAAARERACAALAAVGIPAPAERMRAYPHELSGGMRQRIAIANAIVNEPAVIIADEPTTALDVTVRAQILELLADLQRKYGMAVLLITHDLNLVRRFADRVAVMENGHIVEHGAVATVFDAPQHAYTRKLIDSHPARDVAAVAARADAAPVLEAKALRVSYPVSRPGLAGWFRKGEFVAVQGADFRIAPGETLGVVGESGSGKSTLALAALGLLKHRGELKVDGKGWAVDRASDLALRRTMQVVFQDPFSSLSPRMTVEQIVGEGLRVHAPELDTEKRRARSLAALADVGLTEVQFPSLLDRYPHEFSGGQRQRLAIARALIVDPRLLVLDEPTSALDVTIQKQVLGLLQRLQRERGLSYLLITHDVEVIRAMAHQVIVMKDGAILEAGPVERVLDAPAHPYTQKLVAAALLE